MNSKIPEGFKRSQDGKLWLPGDRFFEDAWEASQQISRENPKFEHIYCLARGGYSFGSVLGNCYGINEIPSLIVRSYTGEEQGPVHFLSHIPMWLVQNGGQGMLIADDLFDSGKTARALKQILPNAFYAAVYAKPNGEDVANYFHRKIPDEWVVFPWEQPWSDFVPAEAV